MHTGRHRASRFWEACHGYLEYKAALEGLVMLGCKEEEKLENIREVKLVKGVS